MAVRENSEHEAPDWYSDEIPMLQFERIYIELKGNDPVSLTTYQNDDGWGLYLIDGVEKTRLVSSGENCIFRERDIIELPKGMISSARVSCDSNGEIAELILVIGANSISFKAGEVYEELDDSLRVIYMDESVLVQVDGEMPRKIA